MKNLLDKFSNKIELQIMIFLIIQPFVDIYRSLIGNKLEIFNISLVEIFNFVCIFYLLIISIYKYKNEILKYIKSNKIKVIVISLIYVLFFVFHCINVLNFNTNILTGSSNNIFIEIYYILRTYILCLLLLMVVLFNKLGSYKIIKTLSFISFFISILIVLSNIFCIGFSSYNYYSSNNYIIKGNIFSWFNNLNSINADSYTTKSFFYSTNQLSIMLFCLLIISILNIKISKTKSLYFTLIIKIVAMLMLSTKVCGLGVLLILGIAILIELLLPIIKKEKINFRLVFYFVLLIMVYLPLFINSPVYYKTQKYIENESQSEAIIDSNENDDEIIDDEIIDDEIIDDEIIDENINNRKYDIFTLANKEKLTKMEEKIFIRELIKYRPNLGIHIEYINLYPVQDNIDFWKYVVTLPQNERVNFRKFKTIIYQDVLNKNENKISDIIFGIGYVSNFPYLEMDYIGQMIYFGIYGTLILIAPFIFCTIYYSIYLIKSYITNGFRKTVNYKQIYILFSIGSYFLLSLITGHGFGNIFPMCILIFSIKIFKDMIGDKYEEKCN